MTVVSADWVVPVEGPPIRDGAVEIDDHSGTIAAVGQREELGDSVHYEEAVILPGFVNAHTHLEYDVYAGFGDGLRFAEWIGLHVRRKARIALEDMEAIARQERELPALRDHDSRRLQLQRRGSGRVLRPRPARNDLPGGLRRDRRPDRRAVRAHARPHRGLAVRRRSTRDLAARPLHVHDRPLRACVELGLPVATHLAESDDETEFVRTGGGGWQSFAEMLVAPLGTTGIRALAEADLLSANVLAAHCVKADEEEIASWPSTTSPSRTARARTASSAAGSRR